MAFAKLRVLPASAFNRCKIMFDTYSSAV